MSVADIVYLAAPPPAMFSLTYVSSSHNLLDYKQIIDILDVSVVNNALRDVTGCLIYSHGNFIQVLEGQQSDVEFIFAKILNDKSHHHITVVERANIESRIFESWYMGFRYYKQHELLLVDGCLIIPSIDTIAKDGIAKKLLLQFLENNK